MALSETPLHDAIRENDIDMIEYLLSTGLYTETLDEQGLKPIDIAQNYIHRLLLIGDKICRELALGIFSSNFYSLVKLRPDFVCSNGWSLIHYTAAFNMPSVTMQLIQKGIDPEVTNRNLQRPLHLAVSSDLENVQILLQKSKNCNVKDVNGQTPLHYAAALNNDMIIKYLIFYGCDPHLGDNFKITPIAIAKKKMPKNLVLMARSDLINGIDSNLLLSEIICESASLGSC